jgi:hypothetical protein
VLRDLGLAKAVAQATSIEELRGITLNVEDAEISLAIRDALHPARRRCGRWPSGMRGSLIA